MEEFKLKVSGEDKERIKILIDYAKSLGLKVLINDDNKGSE